MLVMSKWLSWCINLIVLDVKEFMFNEYEKIEIMEKLFIETYCKYFFVFIRMFVIDFCIHGEWYVPCVYQQVWVFTWLAIGSNDKWVDKMECDKGLCMGKYMCYRIFKRWVMIGGLLIFMRGSPILCKINWSHTKTPIVSHII